MLRVENRSSHFYAVYDIADSSIDIDRESLMMIKNNQAKDTSLASIMFEESNGIRRIMFDITGRISLSEYLMHYTMTQDDFKQIILNLAEGINNLDEYMIDIKKILLVPENVYINIMDRSIVFVCMALKNFDSQANLYQFFYYVINMNRVEVSRGISYVDRAKKVIWYESGFSVNNLRNALLSGENTADVSSVSNAPSTENSGTITVDTSKKNQAAMQNIVQPPIEQKKDTLNSPIPKNNPQPVIEPPQTQPEKKKSFFQKIFGGGEKNPSPSFQGYLNKGKASTSDVPNQQQPPVKQSQSQNAGQQFSINNVQQSANMQSGGTTVLKKTDADSLTQQPHVQQSQSQNVGQQFSSHNIQQPQTMYFGGTNALNGGMAGSYNSDIQNSSNMDSTYQNTPNLSSNQHDTYSRQPTGTTSLNKNNQNVPGTTSLNKNNQNVQGTTSLNKNNLSPTSELKKCSITHLRTGRNIIRNQPVLKIGRGLPENDFNIDDNTDISRHHAKITQRMGVFYFQDTDSSNGSSLNGREVRKFEEHPLNNGDIFCVADEEFKFNIV